jgi:hypothetical protein
MDLASARNGNLEVPVHLLKRNKYTRQKNEKKDEYIYIYIYILISAGMKTRKKGVPVWYTGIYRPISSSEFSVTYVYFM